MTKKALENRVNDTVKTGDKVVIAKAELDD